jgi:hypothetical protein
MVPVGTRSVFKSRWMALVWAIGIIVVAWEIAGPDAETANTTANADQPTDATGAPVTNDDEKKIEQIVNGL